MCIYIHTYEYVAMCSRYVHMSMDIRGGQKRVSGLMDLDV